jgi:hypothetical protein
MPIVILLCGASGVVIVLVANPVSLPYLMSLELTGCTNIWLTLSVDHLLPVGHTDSEKDEFKVTACRFCNEADNYYFTKYGLSLEGKSTEKLLEQRRSYVQAVRDKYKKFWEENVKPASE